MLSHKLQAVSIKECDDVRPGGQQQSHRMVVQIYILVFFCSMEQRGQQFVAERRTEAHAVCYSRSALYCAGVLEAAGSGTSSGVVVSGAVPFLSCLAFRTRAARGWSGSITFRGCRRRG